MFGQHLKVSTKAAMNLLLIQINPDQKSDGSCNFFSFFFPCEQKSYGWLQCCHSVSDASLVHHNFVVISQIIWKIARPVVVRSKTVHTYITRAWKTTAALYLQIRTISFNFCVLYVYYYLNITGLYIQDSIWKILQRHIERTYPFVSL